MRWLLYHWLFGLSSENAPFTEGQDFLTRNMIWMGARAHRPDRSWRRKGWQTRRGVSDNGNSWEHRVNGWVVAKRRPHLDRSDICSKIQRASRAYAVFL